ncbi:YheV family putative metal-binding protein [Zooshikella marina]|uniref:YheV family putative zinc ribbon protein n=1 Tax=Zooshikella ganghwensis TaxID=202772 RepID=UPI0004169A46|nr:YheV family putative zinc ribbon protein [Zooshikella ganghwensis]MBU2708637.1 YheV family putative metal-binding protein [Zooshikella ganghwensis]
MSHNIKKRFIAGAVCPRCAEMDRIVVFEQEGQQRRECVACGYSDILIIKPDQVEIPTRVTPEDKKKEDVPPQPIKFFPNPRLKKQSEKNNKTD